MKYEKCVHLNGSMIIFALCSMKLTFLLDIINKCRKMEFGYLPTKCVS